MDKTKILVKDPTDRHVYGFVFYHLVKYDMNTWTQYERTHYDLVVTVIQKPHTQGSFGITPNVLPQTSVKVAMTSRFLTLVDSLCLQ
jgi:hypothetical protein